MTMIMGVGGKITYAQEARPITNDQKPNIIFILTDDLGYGDVGVFFQNQRQQINDRSEPWVLTPNLDKMASDGALMPHHYAAAPVCAPSRASLLSGLSQGHANVRNSQFDKALADNHTMGNVLQKLGYTTAAIGKWGLMGSNKWSEDGDSWPAHPINRGFDYSYGYMRHRDGHEHYPKEGLYRGAKEVYENKNEVSNDLDKCYTGDLWTAVAKKWIVEQTKGKGGKQPFFMYLAFDTPHAVLELPTQAYPDGGGLNGGVQWTGKPGQMINTASGTIDSWVHPDYIYATYNHDNNEATPEVAWPNVYKRFATTTRRIDDQVGDILKLLSDLNIDQNTLVVFSSDNGPSIESYLDNEPYEANFFNSFGPFDGIKRDVLEGGERIPTIAKWPARIKAGNIVNSPSISYDWLPTFTAAAGSPAPVNTDGVSLLPSLTRQGNQQQSLIYVEYTQGQHTPNYDEFAPNNRDRLRKEMQMMRIGDLVGLRYNIQNANDDFEIYNVISDTQQADNLAGNRDMRELQQTFKERVLQVRMPNLTAQRPYDNAAIAASSVDGLTNGLSWKAYQRSAPWLPQLNTLPATAMGNATSLDLAGIKLKNGEVVLFEGYINIPVAGDYTFSLKSGSKGFLKIHEASVIDADYGYEAGTTREGNIRLKAGYHPIKIYCGSVSKGDDSLELSWEGPSFSKSKVPENAFFSK
ncbi:sulfatase-like hydrolase/transferase [Arenibacter algicola]|uniref:sulfatase-like hydrolase/transferase n=1 Tax=Arenibacter algicola TaxID=616991 RepID=UPI001C06FF00|nr:sulfatase-like hydrolase/transferase [Arenibacter algicola]MBU2905341.1 sulfatase-like hydrolase/transferase [Arenibacter algicola]